MDESSRNIVSHKIKSVDEVVSIIGERPRDKKVIMCHGTFDIVHPGHVRHLLYAKSKVDILIASLTSDDHIVKADFRPFVPEDMRAINLAAMEMVDFVLIDRNQTPINNIARIQPDYFAKGYEYGGDGINPKTAEEKEIVESYGGEIIFTPGDIVYSSSQLIENAPPDLAIDKLAMLMTAENMNFGDLRGAINNLGGVRVHVVGDTIIDSYTQCSMIGGMTKTPTMSVRFEERNDFVGGAGIVAKHLKAAGADVVFSTVLGDDDLADFAIGDLRESGVACDPIIDGTRPTVNKNSIIANDYHLLKVDTVDNRSISAPILKKLTERLKNTPADIVVFSDFRHGIFNRDTIPELIVAIPPNSFKVADSQVASRWGNILEFNGFDLITPNEREARFALGDQDSVVRPLGLQLYREAECKTLILKLGKRGLMTFRGVPEAEEDVRAFFAVDSFAGNVVDAVGSGDALLAYAALTMFATGNNVMASVVGSIAAALACENEGNIPVGPAQVLSMLEQIERLASID